MGTSFKLTIVDNHLKVSDFFWGRKWHEGCELFSRRRGNAKMTNLRKLIGGAILTLGMIFSLSAATNMTAQAQWRDRDDYYRNRDYRDRDDDDRDRDDYYRNREYREQRERAERERERAYRNNGYYGNNGYGNYGYNNAYRYEMQQGYQYGLNTGASDAQRGQSYSPQRSHYWRNASSQAFRDGFVQGYDQGYRQYGGYNQNRTGSIWGRILGWPY